MKMENKNYSVRVTLSWSYTTEADSLEKAREEASLVIWCDQERKRLEVDGYSDEFPNIRNPRLKECSIDIEEVDGHITLQEVDGHITLQEVE